MRWKPWNLIDSDVTMKTQVTRTVASCFKTLRLLRTISRSVSYPAFQTLVVSLVPSRLDHGNATLTAIPAYQHRSLQSLMNAAAKLIHHRRRYDHITPLLRELHWFKAPERVDFKLAVTVDKCPHGLAPQYLVDSISVLQTLVAVNYVRAFSSSGSRLRSSLPHGATVALTWSTFRSRLKTHFVHTFFPV